MVNPTSEAVGEDTVFHYRWQISDRRDEVQFSYFVTIHFLLFTFDEANDFISGRDQVFRRCAGPKLDWRTLAPTLLLSTRSSHTDPRPTYSLCFFLAGKEICPLPRFTLCYIWDEID